MSFSIRAKLIIIVAGTLIVAQTISALLIREVVTNHILQQRRPVRGQAGIDGADQAGAPLRVPGDRHFAALRDEVVLPVILEQEPLVVQSVLGAGRMQLHDFGTTFKAYRREIIQEIQLYGELHRFIPALASSTGARIAEVPIENLHRKSGKSNYGIGRTIRVFLDLIIVKFLLDYSTRPLQFFGLLGVAGMGFGSLLACFLAYEKFYLHQSIMAEHGPLMMLSVALFISGVQFFSMGLLGEIIARTYYESQNKPIYALREVKSHRKEMGDSTESTRPSGNPDR